MPASDYFGIRYWLLALGVGSHQIWYTLGLYFGNEWCVNTKCLNVLKNISLVLLLLSPLNLSGDLPSLQSIFATRLGGTNGIDDAAADTEVIIIKWRSSFLKKLC